jgi:hypothetical protein
VIDRLAHWLLRRHRYEGILLIDVAGNRFAHAQRCMICGVLAA